MYYSTSCVLWWWKMLTPAVYAFSSALTLFFIRCCWHLCRPIRWTATSVRVGRTVDSPSVAPPTRCPSTWTSYSASGNRTPTSLTVSSLTSTWSRHPTNCCGSATTAEYCTRWGEKMIYTIILLISVCRRSQTTGRNSCSIVSGNISNCSYRLTVYPVTSSRLNSA